MGLTVVFKKCLKSVDYMTKTFGNDTQEFSIVLKENTSIFRPTFTLQTSADLSKYNYIDATSDLGRKYFIKDVRSIGYQRYEVDAETDVMFTWKSEILSNTAVIRRQEKKYNLYLDDPDFHVYNYEKIQTLQFPENSFMKSLQYVLVTNGAGSASSNEFSRLNEEGGEEDGVNTVSGHEIS